MSVQIGGRKVYIRQGQSTQTVNICRLDNRRGQYEKTYVISGLQNFVEDQQVASFTTIAELEKWLIGNGAALRAISSDAPDDPVELPAAASRTAGIGSPTSGVLSGSDAKWAAEAVLIVEAAIDELLLEFARQPYLHR